MGADGVALSLVMPAIVNTELGGGLSRPIGQKDIQPDDVAAATVEALQTGRFEVWVPPQNQAIYTFGNLLPRPGREGLTRAIKADRPLWSIDAARRRAYELRAAQSAPSLEPGGEPAALTTGERDADG